MKNFFFKCTVVLLGVFFFSACSDDELSTSSFALNISGLEDLGSGYAYEGWLIVNGNPVSSGVFSVNENGQMSSNSFDVDITDLDNADTFVLTIEPSPDSNPAPSDVHILAGDFSGTTANLTIDHPAALNNNFQTSTGKYILATPTNGNDNNENSGIWWIDISSGTPNPGLALPTLPSGWQYEGWTVIGGIPVSTGTFLSNMGEDNAAPFSGEMDGPPFPGEDFLTNAPSDLSFPTNIAGGTAVISIEPSPDNSPNPFLLKPLVGQIPTNAVDHFVYDMGSNLVFPTGTATR
jgi:hypothetical protein